MKNSSHFLFIRSATLARLWSAGGKGKGKGGVAGRYGLHYVTNLCVWLVWSGRSERDRSSVDEVILWWISRFVLVFCFVFWCMQFRMIMLGFVYTVVNQHCTAWSFIAFGF